MVDWQNWIVYGAVIWGAGYAICAFVKPFVNSACNGCARSVDKGSGRNGLLQIDTKM